MDHEVITYLLIVKGIVVGLFVGTVFLYFLKRYKLEIDENQKVPEEYLRSFSNEKTWKELLVKIKKIKQAARDECGIMIKDCLSACTFISIPLLVTLGLYFKFWFILIIFKVSCLCFFIVSWRCSLNFFRLFGKIILKNFSRERPKEGLMKAAMFSSINLVLYTNTLISLSLLATVWMMNRHHLEDLYNHESYTRNFEFLLTFSLFVGVLSLISTLYSSQYSTSAEIVSHLVSSGKFNLEQCDSRDPSTMTKLSGRVFSSVTSDSGRYFFTVTTSSLTGLLVFSTSPQLPEHSYSMYFPITLYTLSTFVLIPSFLLVFVAFSMKKKSSIFIAQKGFLILHLLVLICFLFVFCENVLPAQIEFFVDGKVIQVDPLVAWSCLVAGAVLALLVGLLLEKVLENNSGRVVEVFESCKTGEGTGVIMGLAFGFKNTLVIVALVAGVLCWAHSLAGAFGVWMLAAGSCLKLQVAYLYLFANRMMQESKNVCSLLHLSSIVTEKIGTVADITEKGSIVAEGMKLVSNYLISIAGFLVYLEVNKTITLNILSPLVLCGVMIGCMFPYGFSALNALSVINKLKSLEKEVTLQCSDIEKFQEYLPDYSKVQDICRAKVKLFTSLQALLITSVILIGKYFIGHLFVSSFFVGFFISSLMIEIYCLSCHFVWEECKKLFRWFADPLEESCRKTGFSVNAIGKTLKSSFGESLGILTVFSMILIVTAPDYQMF
jgi:Na+/H+-translocating membrane pyrophosphatase